MVVVHLARMAAVVILVLACTFLPFLPGRYDALAVTLSVMSQLFGMAGLLLVPMGAVWLIYERRKRTLGQGVALGKGRGYYCAVVSVVVSAIVAAAVAIGALVSSISLGFITLSVWFYSVSRIVPKLKHLRNADTRTFDPAPLYLFFVPIVVTPLQFVLAGPATEFSRNYAIMKSEALRNDIEEYRNANGHYPRSLLAATTDYEPSIIGIEKFHYAPSGEAYNLLFEQFRFYPLGTREIVVYNQLDEHFIASHDGDILLWTREQLHSRRGYYAVHDASRPHWKYFWFD